MTLAIQLNLLLLPRPLRRFVAAFSGFKASIYSVTTA
jgi:hypothetical protein